MLTNCTNHSSFSRFPIFMALEGTGRGLGVREILTAAAPVPVTKGSLGSLPQVLMEVWVLILSGSFPPTALSETRSSAIIGSISLPYLGTPVYQSVLFPGSSRPGQNQRWPQDNFWAKPFSESKASPLEGGNSNIKHLQMLNPQADAWSTFSCKNLELDNHKQNFLKYPNYLQSSFKGQETKPPT